MITWLYALIFCASGLVAGRLMQRPYAALSTRFGNDQRGQAARIAVCDLFSAPVDEFMQRYLQALSLCGKWILARVALLSCQLSVVLASYFLVAMSLSSHEAAGNWIFSASAMLATLTKDLSDVRIKSLWA